MPAYIPQDRRHAATCIPVWGHSLRYCTDCQGFSSLAGKGRWKPSQSLGSGIHDGSPTDAVYIYMHAMFVIDELQIKHTKSQSDLVHTACRKCFLERQSTRQGLHHSFTRSCLRYCPDSVHVAFQVMRTGRFQEAFHESSKFSSQGQPTSRMR